MAATAHIAALAAELQFKSSHVEYRQLGEMFGGNGTKTGWEPSLEPLVDTLLFTVDFTTVARLNGSRALHRVQSDSLRGLVALRCGHTLYHSAWQQRSAFHHAAGSATAPPRVIPLGAELVPHRRARNVSASGRGTTLGVLFVRPASSALGADAAKPHDLLQRAAATCRVELLPDRMQQRRYPVHLASLASPDAGLFGPAPVPVPAAGGGALAVSLSRPSLHGWVHRRAAAKRPRNATATVHALSRASAEVLGAYGVDASTASPEAYLAAVAGSADAVMPAGADGALGSGGAAAAERAGSAEAAGSGAEAGAAAVATARRLLAVPGRRATTGSDLIRSGAWSTPDLQKQLHPLAATLNAEQETVLSLLQVVSHMKVLAEEGAGAKTGTIFETIIDPLVNAISKLLPKITFKLLKEPLAVFIEDMLEKSLLNALTKPALDGMDPDGAPAPSTSEIMEAAEAAAAAKKEMDEAAAAGGGAGGDGGGPGSGDGGGGGGGGGGPEDAVPPGQDPNGPEADGRAGAGQTCAEDKACGAGLQCGSDGVCGTGPRAGSPCRVPVDCGAGLRCIAQSCRPGRGGVGEACNATALCPLTLRCDAGAGVCVRGAAGGVDAVCAHDGECAPELRCARGLCRPGEGAAGAHCGAHADCSRGLLCVEAVCQAGAGEAGAVCAAQRHCRAGWLCGAEGRCEAARTGIAGAACAVDDDCGPGLACAAGKLCQAGNAPAGAKCDGDEACAAGLACTEGKCVRGKTGAGGRCSAHAECKPGLLCGAAGRCIAPGNRPGAPCFDGTGAHCVAADDARPLACRAEVCQRDGAGLAGDACTSGSASGSGSGSGGGGGSGSGSGCLQGLVCVNGTCDAAAGLDGDACSSAADCAHSLACVGGRCRGGRPGTPCRLSADCAIGLRCDPEGKRCATTGGAPGDKCRVDDDCEHGLSCGRGGKCEGGGELSPCATDDDCGRFFLCVRETRYKLHAGAACTRTGNCTAGTRCAREPGAAEGRCEAVADGTPCREGDFEAVEGESFPDDATCAVGQRCSRGQCRPVAPDARCRGTVDCATGFACNETRGTCQLRLDAPVVAATGRCSAAAWGVESRKREDAPPPKMPPGYIPANTADGDTDAAGVVEGMAAALDASAGSAPQRIAEFVRSKAPSQAGQMPTGRAATVAGPDPADAAWFHAPNKTSTDSESEAARRGQQQASAAEERKRGGGGSGSGDGSGSGSEQTGPDGLTGTQHASVADAPAPGDADHGPSAEEEDDAKRRHRAFGFGTATADALLETSARAGTRARARAKAQNPASVESSGPGLNEELSQSVTDAVVEALVMPLREELGDALAEETRRGTVRKTARRLTTLLTMTLGNTLTHILSDLLSYSLTLVSTRELTRVMVPSLTHTLAPIVTHALTHSPKSDYYCTYCEHKKLYCEYCTRAYRKEISYDFYVNYYAEYYSHYYAHSYGDHFSRVFTDDFMRRTGHRVATTTHTPFNHKDFHPSAQGKDDEAEKA